MAALPTICVVFGVTGTKRRTSGLEDRFLLPCKTESCRFFWHECKCAFEVVEPV